MTDNSNTTAEQLIRACEIGREAGLNYIYAGNLPGEVGDLEDTRCAQCGDLLIARRGYFIRQYRVTADGGCPGCGTTVPGRWDARFGGQLASRPFVPGSRSLAVHRTR